jgi:hypothetical protein
MWQSGNPLDATKETSMTHATRRATLRLVLITLLAGSAAAVGVSGQSPASSNPLVGAWRVTEFAGGNGPAITSPQPGLYVFTRQHYSFARIQGTRPLPDYPSNDKATDADKVAVFNALYLNTGTYTVSGNMLATKAMVAKSKFAIGGAGNQYEFAVNGNTLTLTQRPSGAVMKLTRLE